MTDCIPGLFRSCARFLPERGRDWMETRAATHGYAPFRGGSDPGVLPLRKGAYLIRRTVQPYAAGHRRRSPGGFGRSGKGGHRAGSNLPALRLSPPQGERERAAALSHYNRIRRCVRRGWPWRWRDSPVHQLVKKAFLTSDAPVGRHGMRRRYRFCL